MEDGSPTLGVGFAIAFGDSFAELLRLNRVIDDTTAKAIQSFTAAERAADRMSFVRPTAEATAFGSAASRALQDVNREKAQTTRTGELLVKQLDREAASLGKTRDEMRAAKVEALALAAAKQGNTDLADRLLSSARQRGFAAEAAAEKAAEAATARAVDDARKRERAEQAVNAQLLERARLEALLERNFGVGRLSAVQSGASFSALAERERELELAEKAAAAERELSAATRQQNNLLAERAQIEAALGRTMGADRPRATDAGATFSALAAKAAEDEARASDLAAAAVKRAADEHTRLAAAVQGSHAAQLADTEAAERLRMSTDPLYAATARLNAEIAESTRLYIAGMTPPAEYARQQEVLTGRLLAVGQAHDQVAQASRRGAGTMTQLSFQLNDVVTMAAMGAKPMQIFASQAGQIFQVAQMAEGGVKGFAGQLGGLALAFAPVIAAASVAGVGFYRWQQQVNDDAGMKKFADGLGLTHKEMKKLGDVSVTTGDMLAGVWKTISDGLSLDGSGKRIMDYLFAPDDMQQVQTFMSQIYGVFAGSYDAVISLWGQISDYVAAAGEVIGQGWEAMTSTVSALVSRAVSAAAAFFRPVVDAANWAGGKIAEIFSAIYNRVAGWLKSIGGAISGVAGPIFTALGFGEAATAAKTAGSAFGQAFGAGYQTRAKQFVDGTNSFFAKSAENAVDHAQKRLTTKADQLKADRTPKKPREDHRAETLAREAEATEAQIRNLYKLADAYAVSGAEALIAEARVKAETAAIKKQGDIEAFVDRQVRLAVAQRVSDAGKTLSGMREQTGIQAEVNRQVAAGLVPAERANELVKDRMADLPLVQAMAAAAARDDLKGASASLAMLLKLRAARAQDNYEQRQAQYLAAKATGDDQLAQLREELRLVGVTSAARVHALAILKATQDARKFNPEDRSAFVEQQVAIADETERLATAQRDWNDQLTFTADKWDLIARNVQDAARGMADAFGSVGRAVGDVASIYASYEADRVRADQAHRDRIIAAGSEAARDREDAKYQLATSTKQVGLYGDMAAAAKGFFSEKSKGYQALATAEKVFRAVEFALSVRAIAQDAIETASSLAKSGFRTAANAVEAVTKAIASLPFPLNLAAGAATVAALASIGVSVAGSFGGSGKKPTAANDGTGTVLGDTSAKSESIKRAIDQLRDVDTLMLSHSREMAASLRSIDAQIGGFAAQILKAGDINASAGVQTGFKTDTTGKILSGWIDPTGLLSKIPIIGGVFSAVKNLIGSLFGSKTTITGTGLYGGAQSLGSILSGGFDASYYSDIKKQKKFLGITTGTSYSTQYSAADAGLENQFTLILRSFNDAIAAAAEPLGESTDAIEKRLSGFVVSIGKIDLSGLSGEQVTEKLTAVFGAAADQMAGAAFPGVAKWQKAGEGLFETAVRVASTVESVTSALGALGSTSRGLSIDAKLGLAGQFDSVSEMASAAQAYLEKFYSKEEQAAARLAQFGDVFASLGISMPASLEAFRQLVDAQDLTTSAGQATYATLLKMAPAFADLQEAMIGAKSAADVLAEREDLQRQLLEAQGNTAAIRALDLEKLDASNRALQQQVWAVQDAQKAADAAEQLRDAWTSVGDSIADEVKRIRGLSDVSEGGFATLQGRFNAATTAARGGDQEAAKSLPGLSQALLTAAAAVATSRQELDRVQAATASSLETTKAAIDAFGASATPSTTSTAALLAAAATAQAAATPTAANDDAREALDALREEMAAMRADMNKGQAAIASNTDRSAKVLENVTGESGGDAISTVARAA